MSEFAAEISEWGVTLRRSPAGRWAMESIARPAGSDAGDAGHASPPLPDLDFTTREEAVWWASEFIRANLHPPSPDPAAGGS